MIFNFLEETHKYGKGITTVRYQNKEANSEGSTVANEAYYLKKVLKKIKGANWVYYKKAINNRI